MLAYKNLILYYVIKNNLKEVQSILISIKNAALNISVLGFLQTIGIKKSYYGIFVRNMVYRREY